MIPLSDNDVKTELSYAYLHALASQRKLGCAYGTRHEDNAGVDCRVTGWGPFSGFLQEVTLNVQLKATARKADFSAASISYELQGITRYNDLRSETLSVPRIMVVLFLESVEKDWLRCTPDELILKGRAFWVSLRGAPESANSSSVTVQIPTSQHLTADSLFHLLDRVSNVDVPGYQGAA